MAIYTVPTVYYQFSIAALTAVEVAYKKSLSWVNRTNNNGNFELIIPKDSSLTSFIPVLGGYIRLDPGDTIMKIEKNETIYDAKGDLWYKLGGRTKQYNNATIQNALQNKYFLRYVYDGIDSETSVVKSAGAPVTTIDVLDIIESSYYQDSLGVGKDGYAFKLKSKGEVEKRYKVDYDLGDTIEVNDTRLGVVYTGVVSGATETIDGNGYNVDIEIGTLGETLAQRLNNMN